MEKHQHKSHILYTLVFFFFLALFTLLIIFNGQSSNGIFSKLFDHQLLNYNPDSKIEGLKIDPNYPISEKSNDDDYKLLKGLLVAGLNESSCLSRYRLSSLNRGGQNSRNNQTRQPSAYLISRLRNYEALYKQCGHYTAAYNRTLEILKSGGGRKIVNNDEDLGCKYVIWTPLAGLGNRMITLASTFLYGLLTNRVLFIVREDNIHDLFCEPFPDVSWLLPSDFPMGEFYKLNRSCPYSYANMLKNHSIQRKSAWHLHKNDRHRHKPRVPPVVYLHLSHDYDKDDKLFFCDEDQSLLQHVPWLIIRSDQYFVPALFLMQSFQQELNTLFPDKETVFHHLGRYLFHPSNSVWGLITRYYETYLAKADEMLGLQIREFHDRGNNVTFNTIFDQVSSCTINHKLLPEITKKGDGGLDKKSKNKVVLVTSLNSGYYDKLRETYWEYATVTGERVGFYQPSHEEQQQTGNQMHDMKALAEVYLLSMSDKLVTSGWSTFGYVAQSLGGLRPWILYTPMDENVPDPPCQLAFSMEPCFHFAPSHLNCRNGKGEGNETSTIVPHAKHCEDVGMGLKLVGKN